MDENKDSNFLWCCEYIEDVYEKNKIKIIGKAGILLSILGSVFSILSGHYYVASVVVGTILNVGVFVGALVFEKMHQEMVDLKETNESLQNEKQEIVRRYTTYQFPNGEMDSITPRSNSNGSTITHYETSVVFPGLSLNRDFASTQPTQQPATFPDA